MTANQRTYRCVVTTLDGQPLCAVLITRERTEPATPASIPATAAPASPNGSVSRNQREPQMTDPQKRYLFRLLAQQGMDGKAAEAHLKETLQVTALREVSKMAASQLIEQMVAAQKENGHART
jgi:hypothetical protein